MRTITARDGMWRAEWAGGRLVDVFLEGRDGALSCFQAGDYDWETGTNHATEASFRAAFAEWVRDCAADVEANA